jgi:hypothetical protein
VTTKNAIRAALAVTMLIPAQLTYGVSEKVFDSQYQTGLRQLSEPAALVLLAAAMFLFARSARRQSAARAEQSPGAERV